MSARCVALLAVTLGVVGAAAWDAVPGLSRASVRDVEARRSPASSCPTWRRAGSWSRAHAVSGEGRQFGPARLAVAPSGEAIAAWGPGVTASLRSAGGQFGRGRRLAVRVSEPDDLDEGGTRVGFAAGHPMVAWADRGRLHVAVASGRRMRFRRSDVAIDRYTSFALAGSTRAPALLVWSNGDEVFSAGVTERGLGRPAALGFRPGVQEPPLAAAIDAHGGASIAVAGVSAQDNSPSLTLLTRRTPRSSFVTDQMLLPDLPAALRLVRDRRGATAVVWQRTVVPSTGPAVLPRFAIEGVLQPPGGRLGPPRTLSTATGDVTFDPPALGADAAGNAIAVWVEADGTSWRLVAVERRAGRDWGSRRTVVRSSRRPHVPRAALGDRGRAAAAFGVACGAHAALIGVRARGGAWRDPETVATWTGYVPRTHGLGIDSRGALTELWSRRPRTGGGLRSIPIVVAGRSP